MKTPSETHKRALALIGSFFSLLIFTNPTMPAAPTTTPTPVTDLYPQSAITGKSLLYFFPPPKSKDSPTHTDSWTLETYDADGNQWGAIRIVRIEGDWVSFAYDEFWHSSTESGRPTPMRDAWPAFVLSEDAQFMTIGVRNWRNVFRIKRNDAMALGFRKVLLENFLQACRAHPELLRNVPVTSVAPSEPQRPKILRTKPDENAPFVSIELAARGNEPRQVEIVACLPDCWFELELHYHYKFPFERDTPDGKIVGSALFDNTYRGYWRAPLDAHGFPGFLLRLPKDDDALSKLLNMAREQAERDARKEKQ